MAYVKGQPFIPQFTDPATGLLMANGTVEFYLFDTSTPTNYYTDSAGTVGGTSLTLNSGGKPPTDLFFDTAITYKIVVKNAAGTVIDTIKPFTVGVDLSLIPNNTATLATVADLQAADLAGVAAVQTLGYATAGDGGGALYRADTTDNLTADDGFLCIVSNDGVRFKLQIIDITQAAWAGAVADGSTDDYSALLTGINNANKTLKLKNANYAVGSKISVTNQGARLEGDNTSYLYSPARLLPNSALADYLIQTAVTKSSMTFRNFEIDGQGTTNLLGGIYIKDDGSSLNTGNTLENLRILDIDTDGAAGIFVEGWGTTIDHTYIRQLRRGYGVRFGASGVTGTTQYMKRLYIGECDICVSISATTLGVTAVNPILESSTVGWYQRSNKATIIEPYFENVNRPNNDGINYSSLVKNKIQDNAGQPIDYFIYLDGASAVLRIVGGRLSSLNSVANSKFLGVGSTSVCVLESFEFPDSFDERHIAEVGTGRIEIIDPINLDIEAVKDAVSLIKWGDGTDSFVIQNGVVHSTGPSESTNYNLSRRMGDVHTFSDVDTAGVVSASCSFSNEDTTTSTVSGGGNSFDVSDASNYRAGDSVCIRLDDRSWHYSTIASISTNAITMSDNTASTATSGNTVKFWRWGDYQTVANEKSGTSISSSGTEEILPSIPLSQTTMKTVLVVAEQSNSIVGVYRLYCENRSGAGAAIRAETCFEDAGFSSPSFSISYSNGLADIDMTNNDASAASVSAKTVESINI